MWVNNMEELCGKETEVFSWVRDIILKYCPVVDDRLCYMSNAHKTPELDIRINFLDDECYIDFLFGTNSFKRSLPEKADINRNISIKELTDLIDYILNDHDYISLIDLREKKNYRLEDVYEFIIKFPINWSDKTIKGILCGNITLEIDFGKKYELVKEYVIAVFDRYRDKLETTEFFKYKKNECISALKKSYFSSVDKNEMISYISSMSEDDLRKLLLGIDNDLFASYSDINTKINLIPQKQFKKDY